MNLDAEFLRLIWCTDIEHRKLLKNNSEDEYKKGYYQCIQEVKKYFGIPEELIDVLNVEQPIKTDGSFDKETKENG